MAKTPAPLSAGILLFRRTAGDLEVFLAHPGGPFWAKRDAGAWSIPKGLVEEGEDPLAAACREFVEETGIQPAGPFRSLGTVTQKSRKVVYAWACEGDADPEKVRSNEVRLEWPRGSGRLITFPEIDRCAWYDLKTADRKINSAQRAFLDRLAAITRL